MLFFQMVLFGGYLYAHLLATKLSLRWQAIIHGTLMFLALALLPIAPSDSWKPDDPQWPAAQILLLLLVHIGLPYFLLSANGPLLQHWFSYLSGGKPPYRLYALSNIGSLLALLSYPFVVEPVWSIPTQSSIWGWGYLLFATLILPIAIGLYFLNSTAEQPSSGQPATETPGPTPNWRTILTWLALPGVACMMLLATTNHVCQDMAVVPFLWVIPLSLYLLTFIFCFDGQGWYRRNWIGWSTIAAIALIGPMELLGGMLDITWVALIYFSAMFFGCMICHGELVRLKPDPKYLTAFYLSISAGGAMGGIVVSVVCPIVFSQYYEMPIGLLIVFALAAIVVVKHESSQATVSLKTMALLLSGLLLALPGQLRSFQSDYIESQRNFYGVLNIGTAENSEGLAIRSMFHGRIMHGFQFQNDEQKDHPTSYYAPNTGVGLAMARMPQQQNRRIGVVGLGAGTLATYGKLGDTFRFYEINPDVIHLANKYFTFLKDSPATNELVLGDARLSMEQEPDQQYDVLVLDAFSGDAIPTHLLTREAFAIYRRHLKPDGVLAIHVSNKHLDLRPVVISTCGEFSYETAYIRTEPNAETFETGSQWILASTNRQFLADDAIQSAATSLGPKLVFTKPWTDNYSNLLEILK